MPVDIDMLLKAYFIFPMPGRFCTGDSGLELSLVDLVQVLDVRQGIHPGLGTCLKLGKTLETSNSNFKIFLLISSEIF